MYRHYTSSLGYILRDSDVVDAVRVKRKCNVLCSAVLSSPRGDGALQWRSTTAAVRTRRKDKMQMTPKYTLVSGMRHEGNNCKRSSFNVCVCVEKRTNRKYHKG